MVGRSNSLGNDNSKKSNLTEEQRVEVGVLANLEGNEVVAEVFGITKYDCSSSSFQ